MFTHHIIKNIFTFTGRSGRGEFLIFAAVYLGINVAVSIAVWLNLGLGAELHLLLESDRIPFDAVPIPLAVLFAAVTIVSVVASMAVATRRVRDTGLNPWFVLVSWVPKAHIAFWALLLFAPMGAAKKKSNAGLKISNSASRFTHSIVKNFFTFTGRTGRVEFAVFSLIYAICMALLWMFGVFVIVSALKGPEYASLMPVIGFMFGLGILLLLLSLPFFVALWAVATRRVRDTKLNPWFVLVGLMPYVNVAFLIFLLFAQKDTAKKKLTDSQT